MEAKVTILVYSYNVKLESLTHEEVFGWNYGATFQAPKFLAVISSILSRSIFSQSSPMFIKLHLWKDNCTGDPFICWHSFEHLETLLEDGRDALYMGFWGAWPLPDNRVDKFYDYLDGHSSYYIWIMFWFLFLQHAQNTTNLGDGFGEFIRRCRGNNNLYIVIIIEQTPTIQALK